MSGNDLGRRAVACKGWRWLLGMSTLPGRRAPMVVGKVGGGFPVGLYFLPEFRSDCSPVVNPDLPDLTDPATVGCLLALVREAWGDPHICAVATPDFHNLPMWIVPISGGMCSGDTEAEALVAALEAAP